MATPSVMQGKNSHVVEDLIDSALMEMASMEELMPIRNKKTKKLEYELWINGKNIDPKKAWTKMKSGQLERLAEGIFINKFNSEGMPEMTVNRRRDLILRHAVRIAQGIYSDVTLTGSSAYHIAPVDGVLSILSTGTSKYPHKDIGGVLTIYHSHIEQGLPLGAPLIDIEGEDAIGTSITKIIPDEILILQSFTPHRRKPPKQTQLSLGDLQAVIERAVMRYGSKEALISRLDVIATAMSYTTQFKVAQDAINRSFAYQQKKKNQFEYFVYWNKVRTGMLAYDGSFWRFDYDQAFKLKLSLNKHLKEGMVPSFIGSVLPESGDMDRLIEQGFSEFKMADRYISNVTVRKTTDSTVFSTLHEDRLSSSLSSYWTHGGEFNGTIGQDLLMVLQMQSVDPSVLTNAVEDPRSPRVSGMQLKLAGNLSSEGILSLVDSNDKTFTHIIKPPPPGHQCTVGTMEWFGMTMARFCKINVETFAVADLGGYGPTFIAERFDIPQDDDDKSMILMEDFWSVMGLRNPTHKYSGDIMDVAKILMIVSTSPEKDARQLFKQVLFSWLTVNSDMHLKNLAIVKYGNKDLSGFEEVRLSPAYDILCTNVYPKDPKSAALSMGSSKFYTLSSFRDLGRIMKVTHAECDEMVKDMVACLVNYSELVLDNLPGIIKNHEPSMLHLSVARELIHQRCRQMTKELSKEFGLEDAPVPQELVIDAAQVGGKNAMAERRPRPGV